MDSWPDVPYLLHHSRNLSGSPLKICSHLRLPLASWSHPSFSCAPSCFPPPPLLSFLHHHPRLFFFGCRDANKSKKNTGTNAAEMIFCLRPAKRGGEGGGGRAVKAPTATTVWTGPRTPFSAICLRHFMLADVRAPTLPGADRRSREVGAACVPPRCGIPWATPFDRSNQRGSPALILYWLVEPRLSGSTRQGARPASKRVLRLSPHLSRKDSNTMRRAGGKRRSCPRVC
jgi:hypothetical protein